jgi:hypothetical protein
MPPQQGGCLGPAVGNIGVSNPEALSVQEIGFSVHKRGKSPEKSQDLRACKQSSYGTPIGASLQLPRVLETHYRDNVSTNGPRKIFLRRHALASRAGELVEIGTPDITKLPY